MAKDIKLLSGDYQYKEYKHDYEVKEKDLETQLKLLKRNGDMRLEDILKLYGFIPGYTKAILPNTGEEILYKCVTDKMLICEDADENVYRLFPGQTKIVPYGGEINSKYILRGVARQNSFKGSLRKCMEIDELLGLSQGTISHWLVMNGYVSKRGYSINKKGETIAHYLDKGHWMVHNYELYVTVDGVDLIVKHLDEIKGGQE